MIPYADAARAVLAVFESTYDLINGRRHCRICLAMQYDFASGHAPGCEVGAAMDHAMEILDSSRKPKP